jgi:hypothetical protein
MRWFQSNALASPHVFVGAALAACLSAPSAAQLKLSEILLNPPGTDNGFEAVEIQGAPSASLAGWSLVAIEGDTTVAGTVDLVVPLSGLVCGPNGLLLLRDSAAVLIPAPDPATSVAVIDFVPDIENGANTYLLMLGTPPALGTDLDANNDGTLDAGALTGVHVADAVGLGAGAGSLLYADDLGFPNVGAGFSPGVTATPDALYRIFDPIGSGCSWIGGDLTGTSPGPYSFSTAAAGSFGLAEQGLTGLDLDLGVIGLRPDADGDGLANGCDDGSPVLRLSVPLAALVSGSLAPSFEVYGGPSTGVAVLFGSASSAPPLPTPFGDVLIDLSTALQLGVFPLNATGSGALTLVLPISSTSFVGAAQVGVVDLLTATIDLSTNVYLGHFSEPAQFCQADGGYIDYKKEWFLDVNPGGATRTLTVEFFDGTTTTVIQTFTIRGGWQELTGQYMVGVGQKLIFKCNGVKVFELGC